MSRRGGRGVAGLARLVVLIIGDVNLLLAMTFSMRSIKLSIGFNKICKFYSFLAWREERINSVVEMESTLLDALKPLPADDLKTFSCGNFSSKKRNYSSTLSSTHSWS